MTNEQRPRMMPVHSPILQVKQNLRDAEAENANLRDLLNKSMVENVELLRQVVVMQEELYEAQGALLSANKRIDELTKERDDLREMVAMENEKLARMVDANMQRRAENAEAKVEELTKALAEMNERQVSTLERAESAEDKSDRMGNALINIGDALFKNYILAFAVRDVAPSMEELERACETINKALNTHGGETITLRQQLASAQASHHSAMFLLNEAQSDCNGWHDAYVTLLRWSQAAYKRLGGLMTIGVSMTPDAVTARLLAGAPTNVAAEVDPFGATVDKNYSIYTDPLIVGVAEGLDCTVDELMEYAADSVGAPTDGDK